MRGRVESDPVGRVDSRVSFWRDYGRQIFWHSDAKAAYLTAALAAAVLTASAVGRGRLDSLAASGVSVGALGLTFVLASLSLLSAMLNGDVVRVLDRMEQNAGSRRHGLHGLVMAFRSVAFVAAADVIAWLAVRAVADVKLHGGGWRAAQVAFGSVAISLTVWLVIGIVQLIGIISTLINGKATMFRQQQGERISPPGRPDERSA